MTATTNIAAALLKAQQALESVKKDATNSFHRYNYTSAEEMISACRKALHDQGLVAARTTWMIENDIGEFGAVKATMSLMHAISGERMDSDIVWPIVPEKGRPMDKAIAAALTSSLSYWLRDLLMLSRDEEGMDRRDDRGYEPKKPTQVLPPLKKEEPGKAPENPADKAAALAVSDKPAAQPSVKPNADKLREELGALMESSSVTKDEIEQVAVLNGMVPHGTKMESFNAQTLQRFIDNWQRVWTVVESIVRK